LDLESARQNAPQRVDSGSMFEDLPDEWREWIALSPLERWRQSQQLFAQYLAQGGSLDPDPDPDSPFYFPEEWRPELAHGRAGLRLLRRGAS
jgi:hypothetical protein